VASFKPEYNPYAYMVSQLPNMLGSIPDLVTLGGEEFNIQIPASTAAQTEQALPQQMSPTKPNAVVDKPQSNVQQAAVPDDLKALQQSDEPPDIKPGPVNQTPLHSSHLDGVKVEVSVTPVKDVPSKPLVATPVPGETVKTNPDVRTRPQSLWVTWHDDEEVVKRKSVLSRLFGQTVRQSAFPWPGLPEKSCRMKRFGGPGAGNNVIEGLSITKSRPAAASLLGRLLRFAQEQQVTPVELLLLLSAPQRLSKRLLDTRLGDCVDSGLLSHTLTIGGFTVKDYFDHLVAGQLLLPTADWPLLLLPELELIQRQSITAEQLPLFLSSLLDTGSGLFVHIKNQEVNEFVEFSAGQLQDFKLSELVSSVDCSKLSNSRQPVSYDMAGSEFSISVYRPGPALEQQLSKTLAEAKSQWRQWHPLPWVQFVTSALTDIDLAELKGRSHTKV
jgi:hypothetical protein